MHVDPEIMLSGHAGSSPSLMMRTSPASSIRSTGAGFAIRVLQCVQVDRTGSAQKASMESRSARRCRRSRTLIPDQCIAGRAVELLVFGFTLWTISLHHDPDRVRWPLGGVGHVGRDEEGLPLPDHVADDLAVLDGLDADISLELEEVLLGVGLVESRSWRWARR